MLWLVFCASVCITLLLQAFPLSIPCSLARSYFLLCVLAKTILPLSLCACISAYRFLTLPSFVFAIARLYFMRLCECAFFFWWFLLVVANVLVHAYACVCVCVRCQWQKLTLQSVLHEMFVCCFETFVDNCFFFSFFRLLTLRMQCVDVSFSPSSIHVYRALIFHFVPFDFIIFYFRL